MDGALMRKVLNRLHQDEAAAIDARAVQDVQRMFKVEHEYSDEGMLQRAALNLGQLIVAAYKRQSDAGRLGRLLHPNRPIINTRPEIVRSAFGRASTYWALYTPIVAPETAYEDAMSFTKGWEVGVKELTNKGRGNFHNRSGYFEHPLAVRRVVQEQASGKSEGQLLYEVKMSTGQLVSYIDGARTDDLLTKYGDAHNHAAWIIGQATQLLEG